MSCEEHRPGCCPPTALIYQEQRLFGLLEICADGKGVGVIAHKAAITEEVAAVLHLMKVPEAVKAGVPSFLPLTNLLVCRDEKTAYAAAIFDSVPVVKTHRRVVDINVSV